MIGHYADQHFLARSWRNTPLLPGMIPYLINKFNSHPLISSEFWQKAITETTKVYSQLYNSLIVDASSHLPEIRIKLAFSLVNLPNEYQRFAFEQAYQAVSDWLVALNVPPEKVIDLEDEDDCHLLKRMIYQEDQPFLEALQSLMEQLSDVEEINSQHQAVIQSLLAGWQRLKRFGSIPHVDTIDPEGEAPDGKNRIRISLPRPQDNFVEKLKDNLRLEMIAIPAGEFLMGSHEDDRPKLKYDYFFKGTSKIAEWT